MQPLTELVSLAPQIPGYARALDGKLNGLEPHCERGPFTSDLQAYSSDMKVDVAGEGDERLVTISVIYGDAFEGAPSLLHGGFIIGAFDEILALPQAGKRRMTANLEVSYRKSAPLHEPLTYRSWVDKVEGRKAFVSGQLLRGATSKV